MSLKNFFIGSNKGNGNTVIPDAIMDTGSVPIVKFVVNFDN